MRDGDLGKADRARQPLAPRSSCDRGAIGVHEHDGAGANAGLVGRLQLAARSAAASSASDELAARHRCVRRPRSPVRTAARAARCGGRTDAAAPESRSAAHRESRGSSPARCVRRGARAAHWSRRWCPSSRDSTSAGVMSSSGRDAQQSADSLDRRVAVLLRILRQQFQRPQTPLGRTPHDIGERAAAIDPELPASVHRSLRREVLVCKRKLSQLASAIQPPSTGRLTPLMNPPSSSFSQKGNRLSDILGAREARQGHAVDDVVSEYAPLP